MKKNIGPADRIIRLLIAVVVVILYFTGEISGKIGIGLLIVAAILALTSVISFCPIWSIFGVNTCKLEKK